MRKEIREAVPIRVSLVWLTCVVLLNQGGMVGIAGQQRREVPRSSSNPSSSSLGSIVGRVVLPSGHPVSGRVRIVLSTLQDPGMALYTDSNGAFSFTNLREGTYSLEASPENKQYDGAVEQVRLLRGAKIDLTIHLRKATEEGRSVGGLVASTVELDQTVPQDARREFDEAHRLVGEGRTEEGIDKFKRAIEIYPAYLKAINDLGVQYLKQKQYDQATELFEAAIELDPKAFNPRLNMGITLVELKAFLKALDHLRLAQAIDSSKPAAHLYLGIALMEIGELDESERSLARALTLGGAEYEVARFYSAALFMKRGERERAIQELDIYLKTAPDGESAEKARSLLGQLKQAAPL